MCSDLKGGRGGVYMNRLVVELHTVLPLLMFVGPNDTKQYAAHEHHNPTTDSSNNCRSTPHSLQVCFFFAIRFSVCVWKTCGWMQKQNKKPKTKFLLIIVAFDCLLFKNLKNYILMLKLCSQFFNTPHVYSLFC